MAHIVRATEHHCVDLAPELRAGDVAELRAVGCDNVLDTLLTAIETPGVHFAGIREGRCRVLFGAADLGFGRGSAWLLASPDIYRWRREFYDESLIWLEYLHSIWDHLGNFVDDRNVASRRWLERLGFRPDYEIADFGVERRPFTYYSSRR